MATIVSAFIDIHNNRGWKEGKRATSRPTEDYLTRRTFKMSYKTIKKI